MRWTGELDPSDLAIEKNLTKIYSCCARSFHPVEAALAVEGLDVGSIQDVVLDADPLVVKLTGVAISALRWLLASRSNTQ